MALYQPTNCIPSSYTNVKTIDVNDKMEISWQVNGNSAMTAFQIDFYLNDTASTHVRSTGKLTDNCPFYGTDRFGKPQFFTWNSGLTWAAKDFTNGNEYKYKITQWYRGGSNYEIELQESISGIGGRYYFSFTDFSGTIQYIIFSPPLSIIRIGYNATTNTLSYTEIGGSTGTITNFAKSEERPTNIPNENYLGIAVNEESVSQLSDSVIKSRTTPTLTLFQIDKNYKDKTLFPPKDGLATSIGYFIAKYEQAQDDPIRWVRWQIATANNSVVSDILTDTGPINTPTLQFEFNGFFNGNQYAIRVTGESESGQTFNAQEANENGWIFFNINIQNQGRYDGDFTVQCLNKENAALLQWEGVEVIPPKTSPDGYHPTISNGSITLLPKDGDTEYSVTWDNKGKNKNGSEIPMQLAPQWTVVWKGKLNLTTERQSIGINGVANTQREFNGELYWYYSDSYTLNPTIDKILKTEVKTYSPTANDLIYELVPIQTQNGIKATIYLMTKSLGATVSAEVTYTTGELVSPKGKVLSVFSNASDLISINQNSNADSNQFTVFVNSTPNIISIDDTPDEVAFIVSNNNLEVYFYLRGSVLYQKSLPLNYIQRTITSISIFGGDSGATVDCVSIYKGSSSEQQINNLYNSSNFEPVWNDPSYKLYMTANFNDNLEGGTGTTTGYGFRVYRQEVGKNYLQPIATVNSTVTSLKDYGISSRKAYKYSLHAYDTNGAFMSAVEAPNVIATCFKNYWLLVCDYDYDKDEYHVRKQYLFALNLSNGSVGNNNSPQLNANFTRYPTRTPSPQNYASGTLSGLIGAIYTVPALIEQIGQFKHTTKPSTLDYFDSVDLEKELYDLSTSPYQLFLRDMKGRLRMIDTNGAITMTTNIKQKQQPISISFPWVETGDASDVTIIQTPDDYGWNNDSQLLDVTLDVDPTTGELSANYPFPYNGTKFYLTGVNKEMLSAKTPNGITPATVTLSEVAEQPDDGEVNASVTVNTENKG